jgi:sulfur dioxygenase
MHPAAASQSVQLPIQLFDPDSSTFTYLLVAGDGVGAVLIDPVDRHLERDLAHLQRLSLRLDYVLETHAHADHVTSAGKLRALTGARAGAPSGCGIAPAELQLVDGDSVPFGAAADGDAISVLHTPGHTAGSMSYLWRGNLFSGDTLLIGGCGRTDFQGGDAGALFDSVTGRLFTLPPATRVWPGHDYHGQFVSTIGHERRHNARLAGRTRSEFITLMAELHLPRPALMDVAVPANQNLGLPHGL